MIREIRKLQNELCSIERNSSVEKVFRRQSKEEFYKK